MEPKEGALWSPQEAVPQDLCPGGPDHTLGALMLCRAPPPSSSAMAVTAARAVAWAPGSSAPSLYHLRALPPPLRSGWELGSPQADPLLLSQPPSPPRLLSPVAHCRLVASEFGAGSHLKMQPLAHLPTKLTEHQNQALELPSLAPESCLKASLTHSDKQGFRGSHLRDFHTLQWTSQSINSLKRIVACPEGTEPPLQLGTWARPSERGSRKDDLPLDADGVSSALRQAHVQISIDEKNIESVCRLLPSRPVLQPPGPLWRQPVSALSWMSLQRRFMHLREGLGFPVPLPLVLPLPVS